MKAQFPLRLNEIVSSYHKRKLDENAQPRDSKWHTLGVFNIPALW